MIRTSRIRRAIVDIANAAERRHTVRGFVEWDVTEPRDAIRRFEAATGEKISFTGYIVSCLGASLYEHPAIQAAVDWRGRLLVPRSIDVATMVETNDGDTSVPFLALIRSAELKTPLEVTRELRAIQHDPHSQHTARRTAIAAWTPSLLRRLVVRLITRSPAMSRRVKGTASVTSLGMFYGSRGWGTALLHHPVNVVVGGIAVDGRHDDAKEWLCVTLEFDHDVVDGAPAARFASDFRRRVESGWHLPTPAGVDR